MCIVCVFVYCVYVCVHVYVCMHVLCMCVCLCVFMYVSVRACVCLCGRICEFLGRGGVDQGITVCECLIMRTSCTPAFR